MEERSTAVMKMLVYVDSFGILVDHRNKDIEVKSLPLNHPMIGHEGILKLTIERIEVPSEKSEERHIIKAELEEYTFNEDALLTLEDHYFEDMYAFEG